MENERDRLKHLLVILLEALSVAPDNGELRSQAIQDRVSAAGLDEADVNGLLDWIEAQWQPADRTAWQDELMPDVPSGESFRIFTEVDSESLAPAALGFLIDLVDRGQISRNQMEAVIQYASFVAISPLERDDLESVIEQVLFRSRRPGLTGGVAEGYESRH